MTKPTDRPEEAIGTCTGDHKRTPHVQRGTCRNWRPQQPPPPPADGTVGHSPLPWRTEGDVVVGAGGRTVAACDGPHSVKTDYANAAFICLCVNSHDSLVGALERLLAAAEELHDKLSDEYTCYDYLAAQAVVRRVLEEVKGK